MAGAEPRFGTTATYMRSEYHKYLASASTTNNCYDYINRLLPSIFNALTQIHGKVRSRSRRSRSRRRQHGHRIDRAATAAPDLEVHARTRRAAGIAGLGNSLAFLHLIALLDQQGIVVAVGGNVAAGMLDQDQITEMGDFAAGIDHGAAI